MLPQTTKRGRLLPAHLAKYLGHSSTTRLCANPFFFGIKFSNPLVQSTLLHRHAGSEEASSIRLAEFYKDKS